MQESRLKIRGLYSLQNPYSEVPEGALETADNIVIDRDSIAGPRRGFNALAGTFGASGDRANVLYEFQDKLIAHYGTTGLAYYDGSAWQAYSGSYSAPDYSTDDGARIRFSQANENLYFTTSAGVKKLDTYNGTVSSAGAPKALGAVGSLTNSGSGNVTTASSQVGYRLVWGIKDANNNLVLGAPSQRIVLVSSTAVSDVQLVVDIPSDVTTSHFLQVYRTHNSATSAVDPGEEMYLVYEANPTSSEITARSMTVTDETPDDLTGATLYTSPSQEGILQSNERPPLAHDIATYKGYTLYANTVSKHRYTITLLGVGSPNGLQDGDTIVIRGVTYTAKSTPAASTDFQLSSDPSASTKIQETALDLVKVVNQYTSNTSVYAYYLSGPDDLPGQILIEERGLGGSSFTITTSRATCWSPDATGGVSSSNDVYKNAVYVSKMQQPEAVPLTNVFRIGSASDPILRIIPLRSSVLVFKETEGVYRITGDDINSFTVELFTASTRLLAPNSAAVLNNQVFALCDQGVVALTENNDQVVSRPIEDKLLELFGSNLSAVQTLSWAVTYESDRKYILNVITDSTDAYTTQTFVWNVFTNTWTRWTLTKSCGLVRPSDNTLYMGDAVNNRVSSERKTFTFRDTVDEAVDVVVSAVSGTTVTVSDASVAAIGDVYYESDSVYGRVTAVDPAANTLTLDYDAGFSTGTHSLLKAFTATIKWAPFHGGAPMMAKHFRECALIFDKDFVLGDVTFTSELSTASDTVSISGTSAGLFGLFPFGEGPFGGAAPRHIARTYVPLEKRRAAQLSVEFSQSSGYSDFRLAGAQITFNPLTEKVAR